MADQTLLAQARKARFDDLPSFSGHPSEDVERFLKSIKNITKASNESENREPLEIVRGKLIQSAGLWFDNNEHTFKKWSDFETQFRNRYASTTIVHKKFDKLKQRSQLQDEPVTAYIDDVINLCRDIDPSMSDSTIIQHLMSGINPDFRKEISRHESCMNSLNEFSKYAKIEQDLYDTFETTRQASIDSHQHTFTISHSRPPTFTRKHNYTKIQQPMKQNKFPTQSFDIKRNPNHQPEIQFNHIPNRQHFMTSHANTFRSKHLNNQKTFQQQFNFCKICGRNNHQTNNCYYKHTTGCFKCGQNHHIRDCTMPPNFQ